MPKPNPLLALVRPQIESDPATAARRLEALPEEAAVQALTDLPASLAALVFPHLQVSYAAALLRSAGPEVFQATSKVLDPHRAATIFMHLPEDARERLLPHLPDKLKARVQELLTYPEDSVGSLMSSGFLAFPKDMRVKDAITKLRSLNKKRMAPSYAYVVDEEDRLVGVMNMYELLLASPSATLESVVRPEVFAVHCFMDFSEAANELSKRRFFAAPVVDGENRLLGVIKAEHLLKEMQVGATEDLQTMFGAGADERVFSPISFSLKKRLPWLQVNLVTAFLAAGVVALFEGVIARLSMLAVFLPVVAGQGGNAGAQSLAIVMRGLVMREIPRKRVGRLILKEGMLGAMTGTITGIVTALVAWGWYGNPWLGLVVGMGMVVNLVCAGLAGASIPLLMRAAGLDPAQCSSILLTTVTDVVGFFAFLGFAVLLEARMTG
jgi:magnesium transporter